MSNDLKRVLDLRLINSDNTFSYFNNYWSDNESPYSTLGWTILRLRPKSQN